MAGAFVLQPSREKVWLGASDQSGIEACSNEHVELRFLVLQDLTLMPPEDKAVTTRTSEETHLATPAYGKAISSACCICRVLASPPTPRLYLGGLPPGAKEKAVTGESCHFHGPASPQWHLEGTRTLKQTQPPEMAQELAYDLQSILRTVTFSHGTLM